MHIKDAKGNGNTFRLSNTTQMTPIVYDFKNIPISIYLNYQCHQHSIEFYKIYRSYAFPNYVFLHNKTPRKMKYTLILFFFLAFATYSKGQDMPKIYDPCQQFDTNAIRGLMTGTWIDSHDTSHLLIITDDSLTEKIVIMEGANKKVNVSYFSYKFTDNMFSSDAVTCYSLVEYMDGYPTHTTFAINSITPNYLLLGATGKMIYKRKK